MKIDNLTDVTVEELEKIKESNPEEVVIINGTEYGRPIYDYSINDVIEIKKAIQEVVESVPEAFKESKKTELGYVYVKLAYMLERNPDHNSIYFLSGYDLDRAENAGIDFNVRSSCDLTGIVSKQTLTRGAAIILEEVAKELGIEARTIFGGACFFDRAQPMLAWTQVKIDDTWYNCDLLNDQNFIKNGNALPRFLKSDADCKFHFKPRYTAPEPCTVSISDEEQEKLISKPREMILEEKAKQLKEQREREVSEQVESKLKKVPSFLRPYIKEKIERRVRQNHVKTHGNW